jgi:hypothetical protein
MSKNQVTDPITDQEIAFARKVPAQKAQKHRILSNFTKPLPSDEALPRRSGIGQGRPGASGRVHRVLPASGQSRFVLKRPKSIEFYRILKRHSPRTRRFHEDPASGRADPARLDEFTGSYQLPGNQGLCSKGPKASNFIEFYKGTPLGRCASTKTRHSPGPTPHVWMSSPGPASFRQSSARAMPFSCAGWRAKVRLLPESGDLPFRTGVKRRILFSSRCGREGGCTG